MSDPRTLEERIHEWLAWWRDPAAKKATPLTSAHELLVEANDHLAAVVRENATLREQLASAKADGERLTFLIDCGPPGASQDEWLSEEAWEAATCHVEDDGTDQDAMRAAIDAARAAGGEGGER
jgi:hypothetical protein